jgi:PAS domain-containing protein
MTLAAKRSKPRVRFSIFVRTALITTVVSVVTAATITVLSFRTTTELAYDGLRAKAEAVTAAIAAPAGPAIRFARMEALDADLRRLLEVEAGAAVAAVVLDAEGEVLLEAGPGLSQAGATLMARGAAALSGGERAVSPDDVVIAVPVTFGNTADIVGVVAIAWSADPALASIRQASACGSSSWRPPSSPAWSRAAPSTSVGASATRLRAVGRAMKTVVGGRYDIDIPETGRSDEIGLMARDLEYFRGMMKDASAATETAMFQSAAFRSCRAAMILADRDFNIIMTNDAFNDVMKEHLNEMQKAFPGTDFSNIVGKSFDIFHRNPDHNRRMLTDPGSLPMISDIRIGSSIHQLQVNAVLDAAGEVAGFVVQWADVTEIRKDAAVMKALQAMQVGIQFDEAGGYVSGNARFEALVAGDPSLVAGRAIGTARDGGRRRPRRSREAASSRRDGHGPLPGRTRPQGYASARRQLLSDRGREGAVHRLPPPRGST